MDFAEFYDANHYHTSDPANVRCITETNIVYFIMTNSLKGDRFLSGALEKGRI